MTNCSSYPKHFIGLAREEQTPPQQLLYSLRKITRGMDYSSSYLFVVSRSTRSTHISQQAILDVFKFSVSAKSHNPIWETSFWTGSPHQYHQYSQKFLERIRQFGPIKYIQANLLESPLVALIGEEFFWYNSALVNSLVDHGKREISTINQKLPHRHRAVQAAQSCMCLG